MDKPSKFHIIAERLKGMQTRPTVSLFVDLDAVLQENLSEDDSQDDAIARALYAFAQSLGRVVTAKTYFMSELDEQEFVDSHVWVTFGFDPIAVPQDACTQDKVNLSLLFDAYDTIKQTHSDTCVLVTGSTNYTALARKLISQGTTVVMVSNYDSHLRTLPRDSCTYIPIDSVMGHSEEKQEDQGKTTLDVQNYPFHLLIRLLAESERLMPFVGAKYFVTKVMWRLKDLTTHEEKQLVFQEAAERGIVLLYEMENINNNERPVSACRLNPENSLVLEVLGRVPPTHQKRITVKVAGQHRPETTSAPSEPHPTL